MKEGYKIKLFVAILILISVVCFVIATTKTKEDFYKPIEVIKIEKMIDKLNPTVDSNTKTQIAYAICENGKVYNIDFKNLVAIAYVESRFNPYASNKCGDRGLMQINMPVWGEELNVSERDMFNPFKSVETACKIISICRENGKHITYYHSSTPRKRIAYKQRLQNALQKLKEV